MASRSELFDRMMEDYNLSNDEAKSLVKTDLEKFVFNIQYGKEFEIEYDVRKEFENIFHKYCNGSGQSDTQMGEILRGLMKLCYRYENDGDEIEVGPYSGIWYGLREKLECPFIACDNGVEWWNPRFDVFNCFISHGMGMDYVKNIAFNALILETFADEYDWRPSIDIADYYDYIINFIVDKDIVDKFKKYELDITHNFGVYNYPEFGSSWLKEYEINSIAEDMHITIPLNNKEFKIVYIANMNCKFELSFNWECADTILSEYAELLKYLIQLSTVHYKKYIYEEELNEALKPIGFEVKDKFIQKIA